MRHPQDPARRPVDDRPGGLGRHDQLSIGIQKIHAAVEPRAARRAVEDATLDHAARGRMRDALAALTDRLAPGALPIDDGSPVGPQLMTFIASGYVFKAVAAALDKS